MADCLNRYFKRPVSQNSDLYQSLLLVRKLNQMMENSDGKVSQFYALEDFIEKVFVALKPRLKHKALLWFVLHHEFSSHLVSYPRMAVVNA